MLRIPDLAKGKYTRNVLGEILGNKKEEGMGKVEMRAMEGQMEAGITVMGLTVIR